MENLTQSHRIAMWALAWQPRRGLRGAASARPGVLAPEWVKRGRRALPPGPRGYIGRGAVGQPQQHAVDPTCVPDGGDAVLNTRRNGGAAAVSALSQLSKRERSA